MSLAVQSWLLAWQTFEQPDSREQHTGLWNNSMMRGMLSGRRARMSCYAAPRQRPRLEARDSSSALL